MAKIVSVFNHKGGVGKTTLVYSLGWALAQKGQKVLMIDGDPQCNLTEFSIGIDNLEESLITGEAKPTIYDLFLSIIAPPLDDRSVKSIGFTHIEKQSNLDLLIGDIRFAEVDADIRFGINRVSKASENIIPAIHKKIEEIGKAYDYVLIDLSPSLGATNQLFLMLSDYFITPVFPGIFSLQALKNLGTIFRSWNRELSSFTDIRKKVPKMLGIVFQNFRPYTKNHEKETKSAKRFDDSKKNLNEQIIALAKDLNGFNMAVNEEEFRDLFPSKKPFVIAEIQDYNQLRIIAEHQCVPVNALDNAILKEEKLQTPYYMELRDTFVQICNDIVDGLVKLKDK